MCHLLYNSIKEAHERLHFVVEPLVIKLYNNLKYNSIRTENLELFRRFNDIQYEEFASNDNTRLLSFFKTINNIIKLYTS